MVGRVRMVNISSFKRRHITERAFSLLNAMCFRWGRIYMETSARATPYLIVIIILNGRRFRDLFSVFVVRDRHFFGTSINELNVPRFRLGGPCGAMVSGHGGLKAGSLIGRDCAFYFGAAGPINFSGGLIDRQDQARGAPYEPMVIRLLKVWIATGDSSVFGLLLNVFRFLPGDTREWRWLDRGEGETLWVVLGYPLLGMLLCCYFVDGTICRRHGAYPVHGIMINLVQFGLRDMLASAPHGLTVHSGMSPLLAL